MKDRVLNPLEDTVALHRYQKARVAPESRKAVFSSWMYNDTYSISLFKVDCRIVDALVQSYAPQPNFLSRPISTTEFLAKVTPSHLDALADKVNDWDFHAGQLEDEDLIWSSVLILEHVLNTGGEDLSRFKIPRGYPPSFFFLTKFQRKLCCSC